MKKVSIFLIVAICTASFADESPSTVAIQEDESIESVGPSNDSVQGEAAADSTRSGRTSSLQNWIVAGGALVTAAIAATVVAFNQGSNAH